MTEMQAVQSKPQRRRTSTAAHIRMPRALYLRMRARAHEEGTNFSAWAKAQETARLIGPGRKEN